MTTAIWFVLAFISGALPMSVWLGRLALQTDIRQHGDGNPGAANVWRAGGAKWGVTAILLDSFKGAIPVGLAHAFTDLGGVSLAMVAIAPILGHAFSPFLQFRGGKALAVTFGIWCGLTLWLGPTALGISFGLGLALFRPEGWAVLFGSLLFLFFLLIYQAPSAWFIVWGGSTAILLWMHRADLAKPLRFRRKSS